MADIRINALTSTAATTASDDYFAVDGSSNGTRKLSAFSPTLGGNLTVSGDVLLPTNSAYRLNGKVALLYNGSNLYIEPNNDLGNIVIGASAQTTYGFTVGGNLTVSGTTGTIGSNSGFTWDLGSGINFIALSTGRPTITAAVASGNNAGAALSLLPRGGGSRRTWNLETDTTEAGDCVLRQSTTEAGSTFTNALYFSAARNATLSGNLTVSGTTGVTATDLTLGTSGPSVKSTLSARAPRQGLVFDGSAGATVANVPAFGTSNYSFAVWVLYKTSSSPQALFDSGVNGCVFAIAANGQVLLFDRTASATRAASTTLLTAGKSYFLAYSRTGQIYIDGIANGAVVADGSNYTSTTAFIGKSYANTEFCFGSISNPLIYNRALSASEVVALYEAGAPSGADYNSASNTALNTSSWTNPTYLYTSFTGVSATGFTAVKSGSGTAIAELAPAITGTKGQRIRVSVTLSLTSGAAPYLELMDAGYNTQSTASPSLSAGSNVIELTASGSFSRVCIRTLDATNYAVSSISVTRLGLLLAPDAAQAGGGLVWYDTSGNAANISWTSGVSWNVPTSGYVTSGSSLNLSAGGTNQNITLTPSGTGDVRLIGGTNSTLRFFNGATQKGALFFSTTDGALEYNDTLATSVKIFTGAAANSFIVSANGNTMLGTSGVDGGQKLQVNGTIAIGANVWHTSLSDSKNRFYFIGGGASNYQGAGTGDNHVFQNSAGSTILALDNSLNATFAGKITANGAGSTFKGTATNDNAAAGYMGEFVSSAVVSASAVSLTNATAANITSISLTAGDWDVTGLVQYNFTGATCSYVFHGFSTASAAFGAPNSYVQDYRNYTTASVSTHNPSLTFRISLAATTTIYFVTQADFSAGTVAAYGRIQARRVR